MEVYVGDKYELVKLRSTVANNSEFEARLYFLSIDKHIIYLFFHLCSEYMEKLSVNLAHLLYMRNKSQAPEILSVLR